MGRDNHRKVEFLCHRIQHFNKLDKIVVRVDILFAMGTHRKKLSGFQLQPIQNVRVFNRCAIMVQDFKHWTAGFNHHVRREPFS